MYSGAIFLHGEGLTWASLALQFDIPQEKDSGEENNRVALLAAASRLRDEAARLELIAEAVR